MKSAYFRVDKTRAIGKDGVRKGVRKGTKGTKGVRDGLGDREGEGMGGDGWDGGDGCEKESMKCAQECANSSKPSSPVPPKLILP